MPEYLYKSKSNICHISQIPPFIIQTFVQFEPLVGLAFCFLFGLGLILTRLQPLLRQFLPSLFVQIALNSVVEEYGYGSKDRRDGHSSVKTKKCCILAFAPSMKVLSKSCGFLRDFISEEFYLIQTSTNYILIPFNSVSNDDDSESKFFRTFSSPDTPVLFYFVNCFLMPKPSKWFFWFVTPKLSVLIYRVLIVL